MHFRFSAKIFWPALLLMVGAFLLYANSFGNVWTYDDFPVVVDNPDIRSLVGFFADAHPGRPLRELTYLLDHALFGLQPGGWHIQNVFWHGLNAVLVFLLLGRLGVESRVAWFASLLFLVHPIQVEVVANISHRKDSLALCFVLLALLCHIRACEQGRRRWGWEAGMLGAWALALLAKQNAVVLPLVLLAYEYAFLADGRRILLKKRMFGAGVAVASLLGGLFWYRHFVASSGFQAETAKLLQSKANYFDGATLDLYYRMVLKSWVFMLGKVIYPTNLALEYTYSIPAGWFDPWVLAACLLLLAYAVGLWLSARHSPAVFFGLVWVGSFWLPVANLWPLSYFAADRYVYVPMVGLCLLLALLFDRVLRTTTGRALVPAALIAILGVLTWQQNRVWKNPETLWTQAHRVSSQSTFALNNLGNVYFLKGDLLKARDFYSRAAALNPMNATAHYNLGLIYQRVGLQAEALKNFRKFLVIDDPTFREQADALRKRLGISLSKTPVW